MNITTRILLFIFSLIIGVLSILIIIFPFAQIDFLSVNNLSYLLQSIKGNYIYSIIGLIVLLFSLKGILQSIKTNISVENLSYIIKMTDYGEVKISSDTVVGLVYHVCNKFSGLRDIKTKVDIVDGQVIIYLTGEVLPEINIPEITKDLQAKVKEHVENCTGVIVNDIKVIISNVATPVRNIK